MKHLQLDRINIDFNKMTIYDIIDSLKEIGIQKANESLDSRKVDAIIDDFNLRYYNEYNDKVRVISGIMDIDIIANINTNELLYIQYTCVPSSIKIEDTEVCNDKANMALIVLGLWDNYTIYEDTVNKVVASKILDYNMNGTLRITVYNKKYYNDMLFNGMETFRREYTEK
jgi:hypothetical protein